jgi:hypothetical protein
VDCKFGTRETAIVPNLLAKQCPRIGSSWFLSKGLNFFVFYFVIGKNRDRSDENGMMIKRIDDMYS